MTSLEDTKVLAIDGGGTRCRFAVADRAKRYVVEHGPANAFSDFDGTVRCVTAGLTDLAGQANLSFDDLCALPAFVGLAGVSEPSIAARLTQALPLRHAVIADDRRTALRGALGASDGVIAHCGTGSFLAAQYDGRARLAGGWGAALGDQASAQWVGRQVLAQALSHVDGFVGATRLLTEILDHMDGPGGILRFARDATPQTFGALAPMVTEFAGQGDQAAREILQAGADYLSNGIDQMGWVAGQSLCLTGGIAQHYKPYLPADKQQILAAPLGTPLDGALDLAWARQQERCDGYC